MVSLFNIMASPTIATLISFILGVGLATMFRPICKGPDCLVIRGPPVQELRETVYQFGSRCVEFKTRTVECPADKSAVVETVSFADYS